MANVAAAHPAPPYMLRSHAASQLGCCILCGSHLLRPMLRQPRYCRDHYSSRMVAQDASLRGSSELQLLGVSHRELHLDFTLPTGQSFRWRKTSPCQYTGCIGQRLVQLSQLCDGDVRYAVLARGSGAAPEHDHEVLQDYFNLGTSLCALSDDWAQRDERFKAITPFFPGARMLRQDPLECLFQFICSSNNHISRIHGMVERLCQAYGTRLTQLPAPIESAGGDGGLAAAADGLAFYAFPTLEQLGAATEEELREAGFGYRAKFVTGSVRALMAKPEGGLAWLHSLRAVTYAEAAAALAELPGVGPKVAACVCLFSLDKHEAIPVDTHVWQIAVRYYLPHLRGRALTKQVHGVVADAFVQRFGPYAGWAHNTLFISELTSQQGRLPEHLQASSASSATKRRAAAGVAAGAASLGGKLSDAPTKQELPAGQGHKDVALAATAPGGSSGGAASTEAETRLAVDVDVQASSTAIETGVPAAHAHKRRRAAPAARTAMVKAASATHGNAAAAVAAAAAAHLPIKASNRSSARRGQAGTGATATDIVLPGGEAQLKQHMTRSAAPLTMTAAAGMLDAEVEPGASAAEVASPAVPVSLAAKAVGAAGGKQPEQRLKEEPGGDGHPVTAVSEFAVLAETITACVQAPGASGNAAVAEGAGFSKFPVDKVGCGMAAGAAATTSAISAFTAAPYADLPFKPSKKVQKRSGKLEAGVSRSVQGCPGVVAVDFNVTDS